METDVDGAATGATGGIGAGAAPGLAGIVLQPQLFVD